MAPLADIHLVSCIMPTADRRRFAPQAIGNFLKQGYAEKELVILDDGADCVADLVPNDEGIRYVRSNQKQTLGAKRNECVKASRGELIMHWDDDDWSAPNRISYQVEVLLREHADLCGLRQMLFYDAAAAQMWLYTYPANQLGGRTASVHQRILAAQALSQVAGRRRNALRLQGGEVSGF